MGGDVDSRSWYPCETEKISGSKSREGGETSRGGGICSKIKMA